MKRRIFGLLAAAVILAMAGGCRSSEEERAAEIHVFVANSLNDAILELADAYNETQPEVRIIPNALGSQELRRQIESGMGCDLFISANRSQMDILDGNKDEDYIVDGSIINLLTNELVLITGKNSDTHVTGFETIPECKGVFALAGAEVPVGGYSRQAFEKLGITEAVFALDIDEKTKVGDVRSAVAEGLAEIGTVYKSDAFSSMDQLEIIDTADPGWFDEPIVYPMALVNNGAAGPEETRAAEDFYQFLQSERAAQIFEKYMFVMFK